MLIAHWPLNGNTNDISGNGYAATNYGATIEAGKIGQCFVTDGIATYFTTPSILPDTKNNFSLAFWVYPNGTVSSRIMNPNSYGYDHAISYDYTNQRIGVIICEIANTNERTRSSTSLSVPLNTWTHVMVSIQDLILKIYINGSLDATYTETIAIAPWSGLWWWGQRGVSTFWFAGKLNDIRLYNHSLTDMEIQEVARAKILHYTFDDMQEPTTNITTGIISNYGGSTSYSNGTSLFQVTRTLDSIVEGPYRYSRYVGTINSSNNQIIWQMSYRGTSDFSKTFTVSAYLRGSGTCHFTLYDDGTSYKISPDFTLTNQWTKYSYTGTFSGTYTTNHWVALRGILDTTTVDVSSLQIEEKPYATEFIEGTRTGIIRDFSGFFLDTTLGSTTTPQWVTDSKLGIGAYRFNGTNTSIQTASIPGVEMFTVSIWFKPRITSANKRIYWGAGSNRVILNQSGSNMKWYIQTSTGSVGYITTSLTYNIGSWNHAVLRYNGSIVEFFLNGIKDTVTGSVTGYSSAGALNLGTSYDRSNYFFDGELDDFRFYGTPLSEKDIKDLYEARAEIEQSGVLYARDLVSNSPETINLLNGQSLLFTSLQVSITSQSLGNGRYRITSTNLVEPYSSGTFRIRVPEGILINGLIYNLSLKYRFISGTGSYFSSGDWCDQSITRQSINFGEYTLETAYGSRSTYDSTFRFMDYNFSPNTVMEIWDLQLEQRAGWTPFVSSYRPASLLPSTIQFGADEIHETGTANFEDFSTAGISDGLVGYWQLAGNAKDYSGNNYNGTVSGAVSYGEFYRFDGATSSIQLPDEMISTQNIRNNGLTIIAKAKQTTNHDGRIFVMTQSTGYSDAASGGIGVNNGYARAICYDDNIAYKYADATTPITNNQWFHIVGTYNPIDSKLRVYFNGVEEGNGQVITTYSRLITNAENSIGVKNPAAYWFNGDIQYIKLFNRTLTAEEVAIEYNTMFNNEVQIHESGVLYAKDIIQY